MVGMVVSVWLAAAVLAVNVWVMLLCGLVVIAIRVGTGFGGIRNKCALWTGTVGLIWGIGVGSRYMYDLSTTL